MKRLMPLVFVAVLAVSAGKAQVPATSQGAAITPIPGKLTIDAIFSGGNIVGRVPETIQWSPNGQELSFVQRDDSEEHGALFYVDIASGRKAILVSEEKLSTLEPPISKIGNERQKENIRRYSVAGYQWAPDSEHLLFNAHGQLWLYTLATGTAVQLTSSPQPSSDPKFSPNGKRVAFLRGHNLYVGSTDDEGERQLTNDKPEDETLNGEVDWVYAEELDVRSNYFWSPDGKQIAFLQMNEKRVPTYAIEDWMVTHPGIDNEKYPKAGDHNPDVRVGVVSSEGGKIKWLEIGAPEDCEYVPRFGWVRPGVLWVQVLNRAQDKLDLYFVDAKSGKSRKMLSETSQAWVEMHGSDMFRILKSGDRFLWTSWRDGHTHLYLYSFDKSNPLSASAKLVSQVTKGSFEVLDLAGIDEVSGTVYFTANASDPRQQMLYAANLDGSGGIRLVSTQPGSHSVTMPDDSTAYYVDNYSATLTAPMMSVCKTGGTCTPFWQARSIAQFSLRAPKQLELQAADKKTTLYGTLLMPPDDVIAAHGGKVPLITNPYGGPGAQSVVDRWGGANFLFDQVLARRGYAILHVDNRGMAGRGRDFAAAVKGHFGEVELADQLSALDQVLAANPQIDANRLGWWGWSYGGYMTLYSLTHSDRFKAGIAVAPVTDWRLYDSIYTERYMGLPQERGEAYQKSSPVNSAKDLKGRIMIVHGTGDDNVHLQNTIQMIQSLISANEPYDLQLYPRKTHGIAGKESRVHLFQRIEDQFDRWLMNPEQAQ